MTTDEMSREFDLLYNNIMSNAAPGIDEYEKSVFLTKGQEALVTALYDSKFEGNEKLREVLNKLVVTENPPQLVSSPSSISNNSQFFKLKDDAMFIVFEKLIVASDDKCNDGIDVLVKPIKLDEYYRVSQNPFRRARKKEALRINTEGLIEIVSTHPNYTYYVKYLRRPKPIILVPLDGTGLSIDGIGSNTQPVECELDSIIHRQIVEAAVQYAISAYKGK